MKLIVRLSIRTKLLSWYCRFLTLLQEHLNNNFSKMLKAFYLDKMTSTFCSTTWLAIYKFRRSMIKTSKIHIVNLLNKSSTYNLITKIWKDTTMALSSVLMSKSHKTKNCKIWLRPKIKLYRKKIVNYSQCNKL